VTDFDESPKPSPPAPRGKDSPSSPSLTLLYQYYWPDDVVSAQLFAQLGEDLADRGWQVTALPCNRCCHDRGKRLPRREVHKGVSIRRIWRPDFSSARAVGRVLNALWMLTAWSWRAIVAPRRPGEAVVIGTDPFLGVLASIPWRLFRPRATIAHWSFDLYPDAAVAEGLANERSLAVRLWRRLVAAALRRYDVVVDLGECMGRRLRRLEPACRPSTLTPWALAEPNDVPTANETIRRELFGDAPLGLLYSGSFGRAHSGDEFLALARRLRGRGVALCFAGRGNRMQELRGQVGPEDANVRFAGFADADQLDLRLSACDLHLVSLKPAWTGAVVPSKFFGALAAGRGVVFAGSPDSAIARWIEEHRLGWTLTPDRADEVAEQLAELAQSPQRLEELRRRCFDAYQGRFSRRAIVARWDALLREELRRSQGFLVDSRGGEPAGDRERDGRAGASAARTPCASHTMSSLPVVGCVQPC
jgi:glycosyltransferase involved in cell wall biosynthesis